jgi:peptide deformylase
VTLLPLRVLGDPILREETKPVAVVTEELRRLIDDMFETMYAARGIGLAATQLGIEKRILVIDLQERVTEDEEKEGEGEPIRDPHVIINPELLWVSDELSVYNEGCLSIPEQYAEVERPARCRVRWLDEQGAAHEEELDGLMATCMQHEIDHLNGVLFIDHISRLKRNMIVKKLDKMRKKAA